MSKEEVNNNSTKEGIILKQKTEILVNSVMEALKPAVENVALINKALESINIPTEHTETINETIESLLTIGQQLNQSYQDTVESIQPMFNSISKIQFSKLDIDFIEHKIYLYRAEFEEKKDIVDILYQHTIFPPMGYLVKNNIIENSVENYEEWILNNEGLKLFYIDSIDKWKDKYSDDNIKIMIEEIKFNFEHDNSYSVYTLIAILIEYMLKQNYSKEVNVKVGIYKSIRNVLNEKVFEPINIKELYVRFIEENLYASTDKAKEFSRHITHGDRIEFGNMKSAMNMIFIYDFLQDVMIIK